MERIPSPRSPQCSRERMGHTETAPKARHTPRRGDPTETAPASALVSATTCQPLQVQRGPAGVAPRRIGAHRRRRPSLSHSSPCASATLVAVLGACALAAPAASQRIPAQQAAVLASCLRAWGASLPGWGPPWECAAAAGVTCDEAGRVTGLTLRRATLLPTVTAAARATRRSRGGTSDGANDVSGGAGDVSGSQGDISVDYSSRRVGREGRLVIPPGLGNLTTLTRLDLSSSGLGGRVPRSLSGLSALRSLNLSSSSFSGPIPSLLCALTLLSSVDLSGNAFSGALPPNLGALQGLRHLDVSQNQLSSSLPESMGSLGPSLEVLDASGNALSGALPRWVSALTSLTALRLASNAFSGPIPPSLGALRSLKTLALHNNRLTGKIPDALAGITGLSFLSLSRNFFSGSIPASIAGLRGLCYLSLGENQLSGSIPEASLARLESLRALDLGGNFLEGGFPSGLAFLTGLRRLDLSQNLLSGAPLPLATLGLTALTFLSLSNNSFAGPVPAALWDLTLLRHLALSRNALSGPLPPPGLGLLQHLTHLDLSGNGQLSAPGALAAASAIPGLRHLDLSGVHVGGRLPASLSLLTLLTSLSLRAASLAGPMGATLARLQKLQHVDLSHNSFEGPLPSGALSGLTRLRALSLGSNRLSGGVPAALCALTGLRRLDLSRNGLGAGPGRREMPTRGRSEAEVPNAGTGADPAAGSGVPACFGSSLRMLRALSLAHNQLSGVIPGPLLALPRLESLDLRGNRLGGQVPPFREASRKLRSLALAGNRLAGPIPASLSKATGLQVLDLSGNQLTGGVPPFLASLALLRELSLGGNLLEGNATAVVGLLGGSLPFLEKLDLSLVSLTGALPAFSSEIAATTGASALPTAPFPRLTSLNLSSAGGLAGGVPPSASALSSLAALDLQGTGVAGALPTSLALLSSLTTLDLPAAATCPAKACGTPQAALDGAFCASCPELCASCPQAPAPSPQAVAALLAFQRATGVPGTWTESSLEGVGFEEGAVTSISLHVASASLESTGDSAGAAGGAQVPLPSFRLGFEALAAEVGSTLTRLTLSGYAVAGPLPSSLGLLTALRALDLSRNALSGDLPGTFSNLTLLTSLDLSHQSTPFNHAPSPAPSSPGQGLGGARALSPLTGLEVLSLAYSGYTGSFPRGLGPLTSLRALDLSGNPGLAGGVPPAVGAMRQLTFLGLHATGVRSRLPASLASLPLQLILADQGALQCPGQRAQCPPQPVYLPSPLCTQYCPAFCARCPSTNAIPQLTPSSAPVTVTAGSVTGASAGPAQGAPEAGPGSKGDSGLSAAEIAAVVSGTAAAFFSLLLAVACVLKACLRSSPGGFLGFPPGAGSVSGRSSHARKFTFRELVQATASFSRRLFVDTPGRYLGELASGQMVAVHNVDSKTTRAVPKGKMQAHVRQLAAIQHPGLVPLVGYCQDADHVLFVYEFVPGETLHNLLAHDPSVLTWERRLSIALGLALGLDHLHTAVSPPLVHLGVTSSEVIVTRRYEARIASLGQSGFQLDVSRAKSARARAYVDPAYLESGAEDPMNDVYSLGVLLLELATGLDPFRGQQHLAQRVQGMLESDEASVEAMAPQLRRELVTDQSSWGSARTGGSSSVLGAASGPASGVTGATGAETGPGMGGRAPPFSPAPSSSSSASSTAALVLTPALFRRFLVVACACCSLDPRHRPTMRLLAAQLEEIQAGSLANPGNTRDSARHAGIQGSDSISTSGSHTS